MEAGLFYLACWPLLALMIGGQCLASIVLVVGAIVRREPRVSILTILPYVSAVLLCVGVRGHSEGILSLATAAMAAGVSLGLGDRVER